MARRTSRGPRSAHDWLVFLSFIAVMLLGLSLLLSFILSALGVGTGFPNWIANIAIGIALIVPLFLSYSWARRSGTVWFVLWIIAVILVVVFYVLTRIGIWW